MAALALPGISAFTSWAGSATYRLGAVQKVVEERVQPNEAVQGTLAPLVALRSPVRTFVSRPASGIDAGDLYATRHVRWLVLGPGGMPAWAYEELAAWDARETVYCFEWGGSQQCLVHVP
jgi:hypothetical protein